MEVKLPDPTANILITNILSRNIVEVRQRSVIEVDLRKLKEEIICI